MKLSAIVAVAVALPASTIPGSAQTSSRFPDRVPVTVALVGAKPFGQGAVVLRRTAPTPSNVIVLSPNATPWELAAAAVALAGAMERDGDLPSTASMFAVDGQPNGLTTEIPAATRVLARLRQAAESDLPGVGRARTALIYLPNAEGRQRLQRRGKSRFVARPGTAP